MSARIVTCLEYARAPSKLSAVQKAARCWFRNLLIQLRSTSNGFTGPAQPPNHTREGYRHHVPFHGPRITRCTWRTPLRTRQSAT